MRGNTKKQCAVYEREITKALTAAFGEPSFAMRDDPEWRFDVLGGYVTLFLPLDSKDVGHVYRDRTLFCRFHGENGRWGHSGKNNMHCDYDWPDHVAVNSTIWHVRTMTDISSPARAAIDNVPMMAVPKEA